MKYIRFPDTLADDGPVILFDATLQHSEVARRLSTLGRPVSAGHVKLHRGDVITYGDSMTLELAPLPSDADRIAAML